ANGVVPQFANIVHGWDPDPDHVVRMGYIFGSVTPKVPAALVQSEILRALNEWSKVANVVFQPAASATAPRTVAIKFASGSHGDAYHFDGPGGILAHTFYPVPLNSESIAGDMHFDADENWHSGNDLDIYSVALHEAGHALGLGHSDKPGDVMYPYYHTGMHLSANDIGALQSLYGAPTAPVTPPAPAPISNPAPVAPPVVAPAAPPVTISDLHIGVDPHASTTGASILSLSGVLCGGVGPITVQWQTDHGYGGQAVAGSAGWLAKGISLVNGPNAISVTAFDAANHTSTQTVIVILAAAPVTTAPSGGTAPVSVAITSPSSATTTATGATIAIAGTAVGGQGIAKISWQTSGGATGTGAGASPWLVAGVPLLVGSNTILVRAYDQKGNSGWSTVVVVRH
ncbi:MAG: matrixin family metalloprotease, partial [Terriglobia bacterium]